VIDDAWLDAQRRASDLQLRRAGRTLGDLLNSRARSGRARQGA
jgi:hypothetical protein